MNETMGNLPHESVPVLMSIAILVAGPDRRTALRDALLDLIPPTRAESGNVYYELFELRDEPGTFYMREAFADESSLAAHYRTDHFQKFASQADDLLSQPLRVEFLTRVSD